MRLRPTSSRRSSWSRSRKRSKPMISSVSPNEEIPRSRRSENPRQNERRYVALLFFRRCLSAEYGVGDRRPAGDGVGGVRIRARRIDYRDAQRQPPPAKSEFRGADLDAIAVLEIRWSVHGVSVDPRTGRSGCVKDVFAPLGTDLGMRPRYRGLAYYDAVFRVAADRKSSVGKRICPALELIDQVRLPFREIVVHPIHCCS